MWVSLQQAIETLKIYKVYMNDESMNLLKCYVSALFDVDSKYIDSMLEN